MAILKLISNTVAIIDLFVAMFGFTMWGSNNNNTSSKNEDCRIRDVQI